MSEIDEDENLEQALSGKKRAIVLFYASWCPFSQKFLPIFQKYSSQTMETCLKVMIDDRQSLCDKYSIEIFPTVILFENGKVSKRLDGKPHIGLDEAQLKTLLGIG